MDWLYYAYTTILGKSEEEFWRSTPRKIYSQLKIHNDIHSNKKKDNSRKETLKVLD